MLSKRKNSRTVIGPRNRGAVCRDRFFDFRLRSGHSKACEGEVRFEGPLFSGKPDRLEGLIHLRCKSFKGWAGFDSHPQNPRTACMGKETEPFEMYLKGCNSGKGREDLWKPR